MAKKKVRRIKPKGIDRSVAYYAKNDDLKLDTKVSGHEVLITRVSHDGKRAYVKTITSLEGPSETGKKRSFKSSNKDLIKDLHDGKIIVIPKTHLKTPKLSGVYMKGIWVDINKLQKSRWKTKFPKAYRKIIK